MTTPIHPDIPSPKIACSVFIMEVPLSSASMPDSADYIVHYCGIECYEEFSVLYKDAAAAAPIK